MWDVLLEGCPRLRSGGRLVYQSAYVAPQYERPIAFRSGIFFETYKVYSIQLRTVFARYTGLRRSGELARKFNPARLV